MSAVRFSWKGVMAVALCSIVVSTADRLFAQLYMVGDPYRAAAPHPGPEVDLSNQEEVDALMRSVPQSAGSNPSSSPYIIYDDSHLGEALGYGGSSQSAGSNPSSSPYIIYDDNNWAARHSLEQSSMPSYQTRPRELDPSYLQPEVWPSGVPNITCLDGRTFQTRNEDGDPIDYLMDPCGRGGSVEPAAQFHDAAPFPGSEEDMTGAATMGEVAPQGWREDVPQEYPQVPRREDGTVPPPGDDLWREALRASDMQPTSVAPLPEFRGMPQMEEMTAPPLWKEPMERIPPEEIILVTPLPTDNRAVMTDGVKAAFEELARKARVIGEENTVLQQRNAQLEPVVLGLQQENERLQQELKELRVLMQKLSQGNAGAVSPDDTRPQLHDAASEVPATEGLMRGGDAPNAAEWSDAGMEAGKPAEPTGAEPETGVFGRVLKLFGF